MPHTQHISRASLEKITALCGDNGPIYLTECKYHISLISYSDALNKWRSSRRSGVTTAEKEKPSDVFDHWKSTRVNCCSFILNDFKDSSQERKITDLHFLKKICCLPMPTTKIHSLRKITASFTSAQVKGQTLMLRFGVFFRSPRVMASFISMVLLL